MIRKDIVDEMEDAISYCSEESLLLEDVIKEINRLRSALYEISVSKELELAKKIAEEALPQ